ncbi:MAG: carboxyl-terminal protease [Candidatus Eremiobacteraeota bacterium]|nr:carboxyl-terminal protease [Candidatus Eremiobacteraeota bacterium]
MSALFRSLPAFAAAGALLALAPASGPAVTPEHAREVRMAYSALMENAYRKLDGSALVAGARSGLSKAVRTAGAHEAPPLPATASSRGDVVQIEESIEAARTHSTLTETALTYAALSGMARAAGDRYTVFLTPAELHRFNAPLNPRHIFGIGVLLAEDEATHDVRASYVAPGTPADGAGVKTGDLFNAVDGTPVRRLGLQRVRAKLLGIRGTVVSVRVLRDGKPLENAFAITRDDVHAPTVYEKLLPGNIGYVAVGAFGEPTATEFAAAIKRLQEQHVAGFVVDLRFNGGGYVGAAVAIADTFIQSGPIVSVAGRHGTTQFDADAFAIDTKPLAVLVNHYSASASEITAGALQDVGVATLVGSRTYGKGVVQELTYFNDGSALKVTTARYLTPHRRVIDGVGLAPDVAVEENAHARYGDPTADKQLAAAMEIVRNKAHATPRA